MTERKIPALMRPFAKPVTASKETARVENIDPNSCPICKKPFSFRETNGLKVKACLAHNIVMPIQD